MRFCFNTQPPEGGWLLKRLSSDTTCSFNTQPPEGGWGSLSPFSRIRRGFQHTAARRRLANFFFDFWFHLSFQHTAARRRLVIITRPLVSTIAVSTHSRPKAAGQADYISTLLGLFQHTAARRRLDHSLRFAPVHDCFNTQPPEGGWLEQIPFLSALSVSTHSRPKAAGYTHRSKTPTRRVSTHSRPKAAGAARLRQYARKHVSTHSRPKAAGWF